MEALLSPRLSRGANLQTELCPTKEGSHRLQESMGPDGIHAILLKELADVIPKFLLRIFE